MTTDGTGTPKAPTRIAGYLDEPAEVDAVVEQLRALESKIGLDRCVAIGGLILQSFFGGSAEIWRARSRNKNNSVRRIAQHPSCPLSKSSLSDAIGVSIVVGELPFVRTSGHIGASHVAAVLRLSLDEQRTWLKRAEFDRWSVRQLRAEIRDHRLQSRPFVERPRLHPCVASLRRAVRALGRALDASLEARDLSQRDLRTIGELSSETLLLSSRMEALEFHAAKGTGTVGWVPEGRPGGAADAHERPFTGKAGTGSAEVVVRSPERRPLRVARDGLDAAALPIP